MTIGEGVCARARVVMMKLMMCTIRCDILLIQYVRGVSGEGSTWRDAALPVVGVARS